MTEAEVQAVQALHRRAPYALYNVSQGIFSVARHFGGITYQGCYYIYVPEFDECIRADVLRKVNNARYAASKSARKNQKDAQCSLPGLMACMLTCACLALPGCGSLLPTYQSTRTMPTTTQATLERTTTSPGVRKLKITVTPPGDPSRGAVLLREGVTP